MITFFLKITPYLLVIGFIFLIWKGWREGHTQFQEQKKKSKREEMELEIMENLLLNARLAWAKKILEEYGTPENNMSTKEMEALVAKARVAWSKLVLQIEENERKKSKKKATDG